MCVCVCVCVYIYIYIYVCVCVYVCARLMPTDCLKAVKTNHNVHLLPANRYAMSTLWQLDYRHLKWNNFRIINYRLLKGKYKKSNIYIYIYIYIWNDLSVGFVFQCHNRAHIQFIPNYFQTICRTPFYCIRYYLYSHIIQLEYLKLYRIQYLFCFCRPVRISANKWVALLYPVKTK